MAANAQPEKAFAVAKQIASDGLVPKVRSFAPVMTSFCNQGKMEEANQVVAHMQARRNDDCNDSEQIMIVDNDSEQIVMVNSDGNDRNI